MRLSSAEIANIKSSVSHLDPQAKVYLFGSRTDDQAKGGDIDLLIKSTSLSKKELRDIRRKFFDSFGEQKMDIVLDNGKDNTPFIQHIRPQAMPL